MVRAVQIYVASTNLPVAEFIATTPETFRDFLSQQRLFVFLVTIGQAGLIADDRRTNALQLYLSKPLTRVEYILGKLVPPLVYVLAVTLVPALLLLLLQIVFAGSLTFLRANLFLLPAITLYAIIQALLSAFAILALSSLTNSRRFVVDHVCRGHLLHRGHVSGAARHHRQPHLGGHLARARCSTSSPTPSSAPEARRPFRCTSRSSSCWS